MTYKQENGIYRLVPNTELKENRQITFNQIAWNHKRTRYSSNLHYIYMLCQLWFHTFKKVIFDWIFTQLNIKWCKMLYDSSLSSKQAEVKSIRAMLPSSGYEIYFRNWSKYFFQKIMSMETKLKCHKYFQYELFLLLLYFALL